MKTKEIAVLKVDASLEKRAVILSLDDETEVYISVDAIPELIKTLALAADKIRTLESLTKSLKKGKQS